jgi:flagellar assembly factor FliW
MTKYFGEVEYEDSALITFSEGLPGFPDDKRFLLMPENDPPDIFYWLQSVDDGDVAFTLMDVYLVMPDYNPLVESEYIEDLGDLSDSPLEILNIVVIPDDTKKMRVNLKAPVVINMVTGRAKQVIVNNEDYPIRYMIFESLDESKTAGEKEPDRVG